MSLENVINTPLGQEYQEILVSNGIHDKVSEILVHESGATGKGMVSVSKGVTIKFQDETKPPLCLFVKAHSDNPSHEAFVNEIKAFEKEAMFLDKYVTAAKQMCQEKGLADFVNFYPKCYYAAEDKIVMEDLVKTRGYEILPDSERHGFDTASFALETLAKHHALTYAMIAETGGEEAFSKKFPNIDADASESEMITTMMCKSIEDSFITMATILENNKVKGSPEALAQINSMKGTSLSILKTFRCDRSLEKFVVLTHGDYKNNNLMFLRDDKNKDKLKHIVAIDLQATRLDSPGSDLGFYLYTSVDHKVRQNRLEELLNAYRNTLNKVSANLGHPIDLSLDDLMAQCRRKFKLGFVMGLSLVGPGIELWKKIDVTKVDFSDIFKIIQNLLMEWMEQNPEEGRSVSKDIVGLVEEYNTLGL